MSVPVTRRATLGAVLGATAALPLAAAKPAGDWAALAADVKAEMGWAWGRYRALAWGQDQIKPVTGGARSFLVKGQSVGLTIVEALDTLWLMGLDAELADGVRWACDHLRFDLDGDVSVFETSIRVVGGLLSGHLATGEAKLLALAHDLATRLMPAFDTPTGMPMRFVNLKTGRTGGPRSNPAEIGGGLAPEFVTLSRLTSEARFGRAAVDAMLALHAKRSAIGLVADGIDVTTGAWTSRRATIGPPVDSWYEYLWDAWRLTGDTRLRDAFRQQNGAALRHFSDRTTGRLWMGDCDFETGKRLNLRQDELSSFYPGLLAEAGERRLAHEHMAAWVGAQGRHGVLPEGFDPADGSVQLRSNALRPELADAAFNLWLTDRDEQWRHVAADHYRAMKRTSRVRHGYSGLTDVTVAGAWSDDCPGYWWSEQMKYYWLMFSDTPRFDHRDNYLSTEGNVLRGLRR